MITLLLIIALLLSGVAYGQNKYTEMFNEANASFYERLDVIFMPKDTFINVFDNWGETNKNPYLWWNAATWTTIDSTDWYYQARERLKSYKAYLDYCYADSVPYYVDVYLDDMKWFTLFLPDNLHQSDIMASSRIDTIYKYGKQPTFEGYVEWLDSLLNQKTY